MTRIIAVGPTPPPAHGVAMATQRLADELRDLGLLAAHLDTRDPRPLDSIGTLDVRNVWLGLQHGAQLAALLVRHRAAAVHVPISQGTWGFLRDAVFLLTARALRRRRIVQLHGADFDNFRRSSGPLMRFVIRSALKGVDQAWVLTPTLSSMFSGLVPPERIRVVENVVDDLEVTPPVPTGDHPFTLLFLGNLVPSKGCLDLLAAVAEVGEDARGWRIRLVGSDYLGTQARLRTEADLLRERFGVTVELPGPRGGPEKVAEYLAADVFVYPTKHDAQPLVLLEAAAAGLPIVSTREGGIADTLRDGEDAVLVEPGDVSALATELRRLAGDPARRDDLGRAARRRYEERYSPTRLTDDLRALLDGGVR